MRILMLNRGIFPIPTSSSGGGAEQHAYLLAGNLGKRHSVHFITRISRRIDMGRVRVVPIILNRTYIPPTIGFFGWVLKHLFGNLLVAYKALLLLMKEDFKFDVIHAHGNLSALIISILKRIFRRRIPIVYTVHDSTPWVGWYKSKIERIIRKAAFICVELLAWKFVDHLIAVSTIIRREMTRWGIPEDKSSVIPSGIEMGEFTPRPRRDYGLFVGRMEARKGVEYILRDGCPRGGDLGAGDDAHARRQGKGVYPLRGKPAGGDHYLLLVNQLRGLLLFLCLLLSSQSGCCYKGENEDRD